MRHAQTEILINGKRATGVREFSELEFEASFDSNIQANLTTSNLSLVLDDYKQVTDWIANGLRSGVGIFEGIPLKINVSGSGQQLSVFDGILDLQDEIEIFPQLGEARINIKANDNLNRLDELLEGLDFGYLLAQKAITNKDYKKLRYVVEKTDAAPEVITLLLTLFLTSKQLIDLPKELAELKTTAAGIAGAGAFGPVASVIFTVAIALIQLAYAALLLVLIVNLGTDLFRILLPSLKTHKASTLLTLLTKACEFIGYKLNTSIDLLKDVVYLASNTNYDDQGNSIFVQREGSIIQGIPNITDYGYTLPEFFQLLRTLFNGRFAIINDAIQFHTESSDYWIKQSEWIKPDAFADYPGRSFTYNTNELYSSRIISFQTDITDEYTIKNFKGTNYQVLTDAATVGNVKNKTIKNLDRVEIPLALGSRKDRLSGLENLLKDVGKVLDDVSGVFGGGTKLEKQVKNRVGALKVSSNNHSVAKLLYLPSGDNLPANHRDKWSAKVLEDNFYFEKSFVRNGFSRQRVIYSEERVPFGFSDFVKVIKNSYFKDRSGKFGKVINLKWGINKDYALITYWQSQPYTKNLKETFIEP